MPGHGAGESVCGGGGGSFGEREGGNMGNTGKRTEMWKRIIQRQRFRKRIGQRLRTGMRERKGQGKRMRQGHG